VVVEQGRPLIGQEVPIVVTSVLQTPAGRMIFGRPDQRASGAHTPYPAPGATPAGYPPGDAGRGGSGPHEPVRGPDGGRG
jgi:hypothetical protein